MFGSLLMLLLFLLFWLNNVFQNQKASLLKETESLAHLAIRDLEDSLFQEYFLEPLLLNIDDPVSIKKMIYHSELGDSSISSIFIHSDSSSHFHSDSSFIRISIDSQSDRKVFKPFSDSLSLMAMLTEREIQASANHPFKNNQDQLILLLSQKLAQSLIKNKIPLAFEVISKKEIAEQSGGITTKGRESIISDQALAIHFPNHQGFLLQKMWPYILFSIFLFSCIGFAFALVYRSLRQQQKLTALKNDFISNVTHELKTPITTVGVAIEALNNFNALNDPKKTQEYLDISKLELQRLSILVDRVLKMALFEQTEPELKFEEIDLKALVGEIQNSMKLQFEKLTAQFDIKSNEGLFLVKGDRIHLTSVIYNLIDNALKYSQSNPKITVEMEHKSDQVMMSIRDNGIGIAADFKEKIFDKFFRISSGDTHDVKGHGLGLSYVASVVKKHQGRIQVESKLGEGSCFTIYLPHHG